MTTTTDLLRLAAQFVFANPNQYNIEKLEACAASLLALADQMERAEPVGTVRTCVWNGQGWTVSLIVPIKMRVGGPLYTHPAPEVQRDAERYRWLRDHACYLSSDGGDGPVLVCRDDDEDAAIDAAMQEPKP